MFALVTAIALSIWLTMSVISWFVKNETWKSMNYWLFIVGFGLFFFIFNIFASVWIWSTRTCYAFCFLCARLVAGHLKKSFHPLPLPSLSLPAGKYYSETGCSILIVKNVKLYLIFYWAIYAFSAVLGCLVACGMVSIKSNTPAEAHDYQAVRTNA